jgi:hypothetical protein
MGQGLRTVVLVIGVGAVLCVGVVVVNQTAQIVQLASTVHPGLGTATLWTLVGVYAATIGVPLILFIRLPSALVPPASEDAPEFESHLRKLGDRLADSPHLAGRDLSDRQGIEEALAVLGQRADVIVREAATTVFISTAVSQSGRLDGLLVLAAQSRMVWRVAHLYRQRPSPRELARLYGTVAATVFVAGELEELDLGEQVEPILSSAVSALGASLPGFQVAGTILANCVLSGSANAFLTLRVGMIAKRTCASTVLVRRADLRRAATAEAAGHLGKIVSEGSAKLTGAIWKASVTRVGEAVSGASSSAKQAGSKFLARVRGRGFGPQPDLG